MDAWSKEAVLDRARARGVFYVSQASGAAALRALCVQLVRDGALTTAGRRGAMVAYYPAPDENLGGAQRS